MSALLLGCTAHNPEYCAEGDPCRDPDLPVCILETHTCVPAADGGIYSHCVNASTCPAEAPICDQGRCVACRTSTDCRGTTPICELPQQTCKGCGGDGECAALGALHCASDGRCVECTDSSQCAADGATPVCDAAAGACRGCRADSECAELCDEDTGRCVPETEIIYVDGGVASSGANCDKAAPCQKIAEGVAKVTTSRHTIKVAPGDYGESVTVNGVSLRMVGGGASVVPAILSNRPAIVVQGAAVVTVEGLRLAGALGGVNADGIRCEGSAGATTIRLRGVVIESNEAQGVDAANCTVSVSRSRVGPANRGGGVSLTSSDYDISNTFIVANGSSTGGGSGLGGVQIVSDPPSGVAGAVFDFNTVADNVANTAVAAGVICPVTTALPATSSIVYGNGTGLQVSGTCAWTYSDIGQTPLPSGTGNLDVDPQFDNIAIFDYHLKAASQCVNAASPDATMDIDWDGEARPAGGRSDIGADEVR